jgi:DNA-binding NarL/FixJ family response regulator
MHGEWLACRALALAGCDEHAEARRLAGEATKTSTSLEAVGLAATARVIVAAKANEELDQELLTWQILLTDWEYLDAFVLAARAYPPIVEALRSNDGMSRVATDALRRGSATSLLPASDLHVQVDDDPLAALSKREREVFELLSRGMTNREIAKTLYISDVTAKVHVRHILKKLGVRSRTEAALVDAKGLPR